MNKQYKNDLEYLDKIIELFYNSPTHSLNQKEIDDKLNRIGEEVETELDGDPKSKIKSVIVSAYDSTSKLSKALKFLEEKNIIFFHGLYYHLTYEGILKIIDGGFLKEYDEQIKNAEYIKKVQKSTIKYNNTYIYFIILSIIAIAVSIFGIILNSKNC